MNLRVVTHSGENLHIKVDNYDAVSFNEQLNDVGIHTIELGGIIISRIDIKMIVPAESNEESISENEDNFEE